MILIVNYKNHLKIALVKPRIIYQEYGNQLLLKKLENYMMKIENFS